MGLEYSDFKYLTKHHPIKMKEKELSTVGPLKIPSSAETSFVNAGNVGVSVVGCFSLKTSAHQSLSILTSAEDLALYVEVK